MKLVSPWKFRLDVTRRLRNIQCSESFTDGNVVTVRAINVGKVSKNEDETMEVQQLTSGSKRKLRRPLSGGHRQGAP